MEVAFLYNNDETTDDVVKKKALITGITGQDGYYLTKLLLNHGYEVHGIKRRSSLINTSRIDGLYQDPHTPTARLFLYFGDASDTSSLYNILHKVKPDEIYNIAAQSHVRVSFDIPEYTADTVALGTLRLLNAIRAVGMEKDIRFYQASSSEMFGSSPPPQNEQTPLHPCSPYAAAKVFAYWTTVNYRESYGIFATNGILFNHESPVRGETFVTRKIAAAVAKIAKGIDDCVYMGNLEAKRDWGHARDYVEGMYRIMQHDKPDDFVLATGRTETVRYFLEHAFAVAGIEVEWQGTGIKEVGLNKKTGKPIVRIDERYFRPTEVDILCGDAGKAKKELNWSPTITLEELIREMVESEMRVVSA